MMKKVSDRGYRSPPETLVTAGSRWSKPACVFVVSAISLVPVDGTTNEPKINGGWGSLGLPAYVRIIVSQGICYRSPEICFRASITARYSACVAI